MELSADDGRMSVARAPYSTYMFGTLGETDEIMRRVALLVAALPISLFFTAAAAETPTPAAVTIQSFLNESVPICVAEPARDCIDAGWSHTDADFDDHLSLEELDMVRSAVTEWFSWRQGDLTRYERSILTVGIGMLNAVGLERLFASYDANGDGRMDRSELLADIIGLDDRPLGQILSDPEAVDRAAVAQRLGALSPLLGRMLGQDSP